MCRMKFDHFEGDLMIFSCLTHGEKITVRRADPVPLRCDTGTREDIAREQCDRDEAMPLGGEKW